MIVENKSTDIILPRPEILDYTPELPTKRDNSIQVCIPCEEENYRDISYTLQFIANNRPVPRSRVEPRTGYYISLQSLTECVCASAIFLFCIIIIIILSFFRVIN